MSSTVLPASSRTSSPAPSPGRSQKIHKRSQSVDSVFKQKMSESESRGRSRSRRARSFSSEKRSERGLSPHNNVTASATTTLRKANTPKDGVLVKIDRIDSTPSPNAVRPYHIVEYNGKKYRLTHTQKSGGEPRHIGYAQEDWEKIASHMVEIWDKLKQSDPNSSFTSGNLSVNEGVWKQRSASGKPIETLEFLNPSQAATFAPLIPSLDKIKNLLPQLTPHTMNYERNPPKPKTPGEDLHQPPKPQPVVDPLHEPPPEELPWYSPSRWGKKIMSLFSKKEESNA
jgi:hypothetical protein